MMVGAVALLAMPALANAEEAGTYAKCLVLVARAPDQAVAFAADWERRGGATPAQHCRALGLIAQGYPEDGALELERAASVLPATEATLAAELFGQAAQAWIKVDNFDRALLDQNQALALDPDNSGLLVDRALVLGLAEKYFEALDDLNRAHDLTPDDAGILAYRASAYRRLGEPGLAGDNIAQALEIAPDMPLALLERGHLRRLAGDIDGARRDWLAVALGAPESDLAIEAQANLEQMDVKAE